MWHSLLASILAAVAGWVCGVLALGTIGALFSIVFDRASLATICAELWWPFLFAFGFVLPLWVVLLVPLYLLVPATSFLWRGWMCIVVGLVVGGAIGAIRLRLVGSLGDTDLFLFTIESAFIGGFACFAAVLLRPWLRGTATV